MEFKIASQIFEKYPDLNMGIVIAKKIDNFGKNDGIIRLIRKREDEIRQNYDTETLSQHPKIETWRKAYSSFGAKPKKYKSSVESLYRMILKGIDLRHINKVVDVYNYISLEFMIPVGGDDKIKVDGDIILKFARGDEPFTPLNSEETEAVKEGEVVYVDDKEVLCRRWNWRECDKTKMTESTKEILLVLEGLPPSTGEEIEEIVKEMSGMIKKFCGGEIQAAILDKNNRMISA